MTPTRSPRLLGPAVMVAMLLDGCVYGVRGGPEVVAYSGGPVITQGAVTGFLGFGTTSLEPRSSGIGYTATLGVGGDARRGGAAVSLLGGLEWFSVPESAARRWGYRLGVDVGGRWRGPDVATSELVAQLRGGPMFRLIDRSGTDKPLLTLNIEATLGMAATFDDPPADNTSFVGGVAVTVGATHVGPFHL